MGAENGGRALRLSKLLLAPGTGVEVPAQIVALLGLEASVQVPRQPLSDLRTVHTLLPED
jgi:hypothetical protein